MKVLLVGRPQLAIRGGGDKVVILKTQEYLRKLGNDARVTYDISPDYRGFDIAHLFTLSTWHAAKKAREYGIPYVLSTIYWDPSEAEAWVLSQKSASLKLLRRILSINDSLWNLVSLLRSARRLSGANLSGVRKAWQVSWSNYQIKKEEFLRSRQVLEWASYLTPSSGIEMKHVEHKFGGSYPYTVVPHGVESWFAEGNDEEFIKRHKMKDFVLCVSATFGYRKNQLSLIRALKGTGLPLVIIAGAYSRAERRYYKKCRREADSSVKFVPPIPREELPSAYKAAQVFALPSLFETPGLVCLEASAAGCNVVGTAVGSAKEYLGQFGWYCNPYDVTSIKQAVLEAYNSPKRKETQEYVLKNFTWERAAKLTLEVYHKVLNGMSEKYDVRAD
ncbi:MAG TPA: glycosyltransferase family 4 protein [Candidatus Saccharicenans sp.]|nr:glycosyltransferase family 4 protein [Candidatus Saccharicenans sp.]